MVFEALRGYVQLATGLTEVTTAKARTAVKDLLAAGEEGVGQVSGQIGQLVDELVTVGRANHEQLRDMVRNEVSRVFDALDVARKEDLDELRAQLAELTSAESSGTDAATARRATTRRSSPASAARKSGTSAAGSVMSRSTPPKADFKAAPKAATKATKAAPRSAASRTTPRV